MMESEEWSVCQGVIYGLRDSIVGISALWRVPGKETTPPGAKEKEDSKSDKQKTTLERRREQNRRETTKERMEVRRKEGSAVVVHRVIQCMGLNMGVIWFSIMVFHYVLTPLLQLVISLIYVSSTQTDNTGSETTKAAQLWEWIAPVLALTFNALWILPIYFLSRIINAIWFQDIADATYRLARGRPVQFPSLSHGLADVLFSLVVETIFLIQAVFLKAVIPVPAISGAIYFLHLCLLYALYSFEYKWFNMSWAVAKRLAYIEACWPYYLGFGLPLALLSGGAIFPVSFVTSGCIFAVLFPLFIISANQGKQPRPSGMPLKLFSFSVHCSNKLFSWRRNPA